MFKIYSMNTETQNPITSVYFAELDGKFPYQELKATEIKDLNSVNIKDKSLIFELKKGQQFLINSQTGLENFLSNHEIITKVVNSLYNEKPKEHICNLSNLVGKDYKKSNSYHLEEVGYLLN